MPITPVTNALPNPSPATSPEILLGPSSISITSKEFSVGVEPCYIQAFGLGGGENIRVEMVSGSHAANWRPLGKTVTLTPNNSMIRIDWPGRYRVTFSGVSLASILVQMYFGTTSHETIYGVAPTNGGSTDFTTVTGADPIEVTGNGTPSQPYVVGILDLNYNDGGINLGFGAGDPTVGTGGTNINIGRLAGSNSGASNSIAIGINTGSNVATDSIKNVFVGFNAANGVDGDNNIYAGTTVATNATGNSNVILGNSAGAGLTGSSNVLIGDGAATSATTINSVCIGNAAGDGITQDQHVFIGATAGNTCTGLQDIAIGTQAGVLSTGDNNILMGMQAGRAISADNAICIGNLAGTNATFPDGSIAIGQSAASSASGKGIYIGQNAGDNNTLDDVIVINQATPSLQPTAAHYCMLGSDTITHTVTAGTVISAGAVAPSDERLKKNIEELDGARGRINTLRPVWFEWDKQKLNDAGIPHLEKDTYIRHAGLIAQEVEEIIPEAIEKVAGTDGEIYKFIHYDRIIPYLISHIQYLEERINLLETK